MEVSFEGFFPEVAARAADPDLSNADAILIMGSSMAENHPVGFQWVMEAREKGAKLIHVDPRFNRTSAMADIWVPLRAGTDIVLLGVAHPLCSRERERFSRIRRQLSGRLKINGGRKHGFDKAKKRGKEKHQEGSICGKEKTDHRTFAEIGTHCAGQASRVRS